MVANDSLTTREVGEFFGQPEWRIRRIVDSLANIPRFGGKRVIPRNRLPEIAEAISTRTKSAQPAEQMQ